MELDDILNIWVELKDTPFSLESMVAMANKASALGLNREAMKYLSRLPQPPTQEDLTHVRLITQ